MAVAGDIAARIARWEPWLGAVVAAVEPAWPEVWKSPGPCPLEGRTVGVKDLLAVAGVVRGCGAPELVDSRPQPVSATSVQRLLGAGAEVIATLALHPWAYGITTPQTRNPRSPDRIAGGSSGGSAAALAAGLVELSLGTDTGGSVRIPAACCGVVGLKTSRGLVPLTGVQPLAWSLDTVGPLARTVADAATTLVVIAGRDEADPYSVGAPSSAVPGSHPPRIGVPLQTRAARMDDDVRGVWEHTLELLARDGAAVADVDLPTLAGAHLANARILAAEAAAIHEQRLRAQPSAYPDDVRRRLEHGLELGAATVAHARHHGALLRADLRRAFARVDVLVTPTLPCTVPSVGEDLVAVDGRQEHVVSAMTRFTNAWNLTGVPAGSVPAGRDTGGAPVGVQVVGPWFGESIVLDVMAAIERVSGGPWPVVDRPAARQPAR